MRLIRPIALISSMTLCSCTTLDESFRLGASLGSLSGALATYGAQKADHQNPNLEDIGVGASVGIGIGLIAAYFVHQAVVSDREEISKKTEMYFGDLPPSPFVIPQTKKGGR